jgi:FtsH-binding integral membrane protein
MPYEMEYHPFAAQAGASERATFIRKTYAHLAGAILAFTGLEALLLNTVDQTTVLNLFVRGGNFGWLVIMFAFMAAGWIARTFAYQRTSQGMQYFGLGLYVVTWAVMFLPLLIIATKYFDANVIPTAGILALSVFGGLTVAVLTTKKDFSFLGPILSIGSMIALGVIVAACILPGGFSLGTFFCFAMVALMSGYTLFYTSRILLQYHTDQYVGAALELFACVAMLFWYILQILMSLDRR